MASRHQKLSTKISLVPYSSSESEVEEELCVGKRGYKASKPYPKRAQKKQTRNTAVKPNPCMKTNCGNRCSSKLSEHDRQLINENFWGMESKNRQKDWLRSCIKRKHILRKKSESKKRQFSYEYSISYNFENFKVCQQFLLETLNISQQMLRSVRESVNGVVAGREKKLRPPHNKSDESSVLLIKSFIEQLPAVPSHYCRNKSKKKQVFSGQGKNWAKFTYSDTRIGFSDPKFTLNC